MQAKSFMKIISVNVGLPRKIQWKGRTVETGIFKEPVEGRVAVRQLNLAGDRQADLTVHGGADKAIYVYPAEYYDYWRTKLPDLELNWGMFGENLTTEGLLDATVNIGDRFKIGSAEVIVTQPRMPCYKLGIKFGRDSILKQFLKSGYSGFYLRVLKEGDIEAGDPIVLLERQPKGVKVTDISTLYEDKTPDLATLKRALEVEALPAGWRDYFSERLEQIAATNTR